MSGLRDSMSSRFCIRRGVPTPRRDAPVPTSGGPSLAGSGADKGWGIPPNPPPKRAAPSLDSPTGWKRTEIGGCTPKHPCQRGLRPLWTLLPDGSEQRLGVYPQTPTKEGCALSGLSRRMGANRDWGSVPPSPHQRGLRPLWTLPPDGSEQRLGGCTPNTPTKEGCALSGLSRPAGSPSRGSGPDAESGRVRCFATHFSLISEQVLESLSKDGWLHRDNFKCKPAFLL